MKTPRNSPATRGFTLMELMVAMAITTIIVTVLVSITSIALDTWNRSRSELRASRQAKGMIDVMARDFEALVARRGNDSEWLSVTTDKDIGPSDMKSTNASKLIFFTAATDRYNGDIGKSADLGGDVSCVAYQLDYKDPIGASSGSGDFKTFVLSRLLVDPKPAFENLLGLTSESKPLGGGNGVFDKVYPKATVLEEPNFVGENIYQYTVIFHVQVTDTSSTPPAVKTVPITMGTTATNFRVLGNKIVSDYAGPFAALIPFGKLTAMEISATVISDFGLEQMRRRNDLDESEKAELLAKNSYQYTKLVQLPSM